MRAIFFLPVILNSEAILSAMKVSASMMMGGLSSAGAEVAESVSSGVSVILSMALPVG